MKTSPAVRVWIRRALHASVLGLSGSAPNATGLVCDEHRPALAGLNLPVIPDVMELRSRYDSGGLDSTGYASSRVGEVCATATDKPACEAAFAALRPSEGFLIECFMQCLRTWVVTSRRSRTSSGPSTPRRRRC